MARCEKQQCKAEVCEQEKGREEEGTPWLSIGCLLGRVHFHEVALQSRKKVLGNLPQIEVRLLVHAHALREGEGGEEGGR